MKAVAALIADTRVKIFPLTEGTVKELIVAGHDAGPSDYRQRIEIALNDLEQEHDPIEAELPGAASR